MWWVRAVAEAVEKVVESRVVERSANIDLFDQLVLKKMQTNAERWVRIIVIYRSLYRLQTCVRNYSLKAVTLLKIVDNSWYHIIWNARFTLAATVCSAVLVTYMKQFLDNKKTWSNRNVDCTCRLHDTCHKHVAQPRRPNCPCPLIKF